MELITLPTKYYVSTILHVSLYMSNIPEIYFSLIKLQVATELWFDIKYLFDISIFSSYCSMLLSPHEKRTVLFFPKVWHYCQLLMTTRTWCTIKKPFLFHSWRRSTPEIILNFVNELGICKWIILSSRILLESPMKLFVSSSYHCIVVFNVWIWKFTQQHLNNNLASKIVS